MPIKSPQRAKAPVKKRRKGFAALTTLPSPKKEAKKREYPLHGVDGRFFFLRKPLAAGGLYAERRRPAYWRSIAPSIVGGKAVSEPRLNDWLLVLAAKKIPYVYSTAGDRPRLYVPPLYEGIAVQEIQAFENERATPIFIPPRRDNLPGVFAFLMLLILWHGLRWNWFDYLPPSPPFPENAKAWSLAFGLDVYKATVLHEWWRAVTALTLHADTPHLVSNIGFGLLFLGALCRRAGLGMGIALAVLAGIAGNACNALTREANVTSIGFSTALFGALGSLCALAGADVIRHMRRHNQEGTSAGELAGKLLWRVTLPLAAGAALLGILGGGGEARTDYSAHIWGFCCGVLLCAALLPAESKLFSLPPHRQKYCQTVIFTVILALFAGAWQYALFANTP